MAAKKNQKPALAGVDDYPERPLSEALAPEGLAAELENIQPDQISDYHEKHPTLKANLDIDTIRDLHVAVEAGADDLPATS